MRIAIIVSLIALTTTTPAADQTVTVSAGKQDRHDTLVTLPLPAGDRTPAWQLVDGPATLPLQRLPDGRGAFILPDLKSNATRTYTLQPAPAAAPDTVTAARTGASVTFSIANKHAFTYNGPKTPLPPGFDPSFQRGGYLFPLLTPSGKLVADDYPPMHRHHHGIWFSWTKTQFEGRSPDFWNMGQKKGTVEFVELVSTFSGPVAAGLTARHRYVDLSAKPNPRTALNETWDVVTYRAGTGEANAKPYFLFDITVTQTCATDAPLKLPKYHYGGIAFRGHRDWNADGAYSVLTSEGKTLPAADAQPARWIHMGGNVDGQPVGLAMLGHPDNFRAPQTVRAHPKEPYFCFNPSGPGDWSIEPGKPYVSRYRIVTTDGPADPKLLDRLWHDYATPPEATLK